MKPDFSYKLTQKVEKYINTNKMIGHGDFVLIGLSGGADSVCLFLLLNKLSKKIGFELHTIHINHCIRGESANRDEEFSRNLSNKYKVPFTSYTVNVPEIAKDMGLTVEEAGRNVRYACFERYAKEIINDKLETSEYEDEDDINVRIAVAHHMNDQAETVLFNVIRGSGIKGIGGMKPINDRIIRPLLCITREEIEKYLELEDQDYCLDETNSDNDYSRNLIRNVIIPTFEDIQPKTSEHIALMSAEAREVMEYIDEVVKKYFDMLVSEEPGGYKIYINELKKEKPLIVRQLIIYVLNQLIDNYKDITRTHIEDIYELIFKGKGKYVMLPYGITARKEKDCVIISSVINS